MQKYLSLKYNPKVYVTTVPKQDLYVKLPFIGSHSYKLEKQLCSVIHKYFPQINLRVIHVNGNTIGSWFNFKDRLPAPLTSAVVYKYTCGQCSSSYIGETLKQLHVRICQHKGISFRTNRPINSPSHSSYRDYSLNNNHPIRSENFQILSRSNQHDIKILESIYIHKFNPDLNDMSSSFKLSVIK